MDDIQDTAQPEPDNVSIKLAKTSIDNIIAFLEQHSTNCDNLEQARDLKKSLQSMSHVKQIKVTDYFSLDTR